MEVPWCRGEAACDLGDGERGEGAGIFGGIEAHTTKF